MSLFCLKTQDLSWQDRTITIEVMMAPLRSQLLFNKHKGLRTKFQQENSNLEREKSAYLKGYKIEQRLMERRKELYSKRRNDIILRRSASGDSRRRNSLTFDPGRASAPPRLEETTGGDSVFLTQINNTRDSKSADTRTKFSSIQPVSKIPQPPASRLAPPVTPDVTYGAISPGVSRTPTPGKPYLERNKSVRFNNIQLGESPTDPPPAPVEDLSIDERIQRFLSSQDDFNKRKVSSASSGDSGDGPGKKAQMARRNSALLVNMRKLETAFDEFCATNNSPEGLQKLVKFANKMKAHVRMARSPSIVPGISTVKIPRAVGAVS